MSEQTVSIGAESTAGLVDSSVTFNGSTVRNKVPLKVDETVDPENCGSSTDRVTRNPHHSFTCCPHTYQRCLFTMTSPLPHFIEYELSCNTSYPHIF